MVGSLRKGVAPTAGCLWSWLVGLPAHIRYEAARREEFVFSFESPFNHREREEAAALRKRVSDRAKTNILHEYWFGKGA
jgi:hypothetical protein